jgi:hypothetical protein
MDKTKKTKKKITEYQTWIANNNREGQDLHQKLPQLKVQLHRKERRDD